MGRAIDLSKIRGVEGLKGSIFAEYGLLGRKSRGNASIGLMMESDMVGTGAAPGEIVTDTDLRIFKALHHGDKSVNLFVTFRERVAGEMIFLRSERAIMSPMNAPLGAPEQDDVDWVQEVEAIEEGNLPQQMCSEEETGRPCLEKAMDKSEAEVVGTSELWRWTVEQAGRCYVEDEGDDYDYDYNRWDDYIWDGCGYKDDDDDFEEGPAQETWWTVWW
ncbi:hypothetical protein Bca4012_011226 [Brassica carinata]